MKNKLGILALLIQLVAFNAGAKRDTNTDPGFDTNFFYVNQGVR